MARVRFISNSLIQVGNILGECPLWHPTENALYWLDIDAGLLHRFTPYLEKMEVFDLGLRAGVSVFGKMAGLSWPRKPALLSGRNKQALLPILSGSTPKTDPS